MSIRLWWWQRYRAHKAVSAERELDKSLRLREEDQRLVQPLAAADQRNHYSDLIRDALQIGYGRN